MDWYEVTCEYHKRTLDQGGRLSSLPAAWQRELAALWRLEADVNNGAYLQFFVNWGRESYLYATQALKKVGADKMAGIIDVCQTLIDEHFDSEAKSPDEFHQLLPNPVMDCEGRSVTDVGSVLPDAIIARIHELSYEFMDYPDDLATLGFLHYLAYIEGEERGGEQQFMTGRTMDVYEAIYSRRDVRRFRPDPIPDDTLKRILGAAHHAGSVGFMQPWNFIIVRSVPLRQQIFDVFCRENTAAAANYSGDKRQLYDSLKLQGVLDAPLNLAVTCDRSRQGPHVLGRNTVIDTDIYSTCCAIQNLWLAARAEEVGVGWVSILDVAQVQAISGIPAEILLVAYLCLGYPVEFRDRPLLEEVGWEERTPLQDVVFEDGWQRPSSLFGP